ncbi:MAG: chromate transporter [Rhodocyclaceae bacterium]|nr:chromate transporter [Rhodocyclaceae bacterium]
MSPDSRKTPPAVSLAALFFGFSKIGLSGFGGVLPFARYYLVDTCRWLSAEEFNQLLGLCQFLPGPNVVNLAVVVGRRHGGPAGACAAACGLLAGPMAVALLLALLYDAWGTLPQAQAMLRGVAAAGVGLLFATAFRMALAIRRKPAFLPFVALVFVAIALLRWPLPAVMLAGIALSGAVAYGLLRKGGE